MVIIICLIHIGLMTLEKEKNNELLTNISNNFDKSHIKINIICIEFLYIHS